MFSKCKKVRTSSITMPRLVELGYRTPPEGEKGVLCVCFLFLFFNKVGLKCPPSVRPQNVS